MTKYGFCSLSFEAKHELGFTSYVYQTALLNNYSTT